MSSGSTKSNYRANSEKENKIYTIDYQPRSFSATLDP